jgi:hypothetical protein
VLLENVVQDVMVEDAISRLVAVDATGSEATRVIEEAGEMGGAVYVEGTDATADDTTVSRVFVISVVSVVR